jgi:hypothetical protein
MDLVFIYRSAIYAILAGHRWFNIVYGGNAAIKLYLCRWNAPATNKPRLHLFKK